MFKLKKNIPRLIIVILLFYMGIRMANSSIFGTLLIFMSTFLGYCYISEFISDMKNANKAKKYNEELRIKSDKLKNKMYHELDSEAGRYLKLFITEPVWLPELMSLPIREYFIKNIINDTFPIGTNLLSIMSYLDIKEYYYQALSEYTLKNTSQSSMYKFLKYMVFIMKYDADKTKNYGDDTRQRSRSHNTNKENSTWINVKKSMVFLDWDEDTITLVQLKSQYRKKLKEVHPDLNQSRLEWANEMTKRANRAKRNIEIYFNLKE